MCLSGCAYTWHVHVSALIEPHALRQSRQVNLLSAALYHVYVKWIITMLGLTHGAVHGKSGRELVMCIFLMELSSPWLHARFMLKELDQKKIFHSPTLSSLSDVLFAGSFILARFGLGYPMTYHVVSSPKVNPVVKFGALGIAGVSLFWGVQIIQILLYRLGLKSKRESAPPKEKPT